MVSIELSVFKEKKLKNIYGNKRLNISPQTKILFANLCGVNTHTYHSA